MRNTAPLLATAIAAILASAGAAHGFGPDSAGRGERLRVGAAGDGYVEVFSDEEDGAGAVDRPRPGKNTFLDDPAGRNRRIRRILLAAARETKQLQAALDRIAADIAAAEGRLAGGGPREEQRRLVEANLGRFVEIEKLRLALVDVQLRAAREVLAIQEAARANIAADVGRRLQEIQEHPARYWLHRRLLLLSPAERAALSRERIESLYR